MNVFRFALLAVVALPGTAAFAQSDYIQEQRDDVNMICI